MKTMHLFAGVGGGLLCDLILGHKPIVAVEWDKYACRVLRERAADGWFPELSVWEGDVRLFDPSEYAGRVDCIHAGFPCQPFSVAGSQKGSTDERGDLFSEVIRCVEIVRPKYVFLENVPGLLSSKSPVCVCGWPYRRGGVHWNSIEEREVSCGGSDNRDVHKSKKPDGSASDGIRGDCMQNEGQERQMAGSAEMAYWRGRRGGISQEDSALFDAETTTSGISNTTREVTQKCEMGCGEYCSCGDHETTDAPAKPEGARCPQCGRGLVSADAGHIWYVESIHGSLASHGYSTKWLCIRASDVGAPHGRDRWFALAHSTSAGIGGEGRDIFSENGRPDGQMLKQPISAGFEGSDVGNSEHDGQFAAEVGGSIGAGSDDCAPWTQQAREPARPGEQHDDVADTMHTRPSRTRAECEGERTHGATIYDGGKDDVADTTGRQSGQQAEWQGREDSCGGSAEVGIEWWQVESEVGRVVDGIPDRVGMLKGLGNAQVPLQAAAAWRILTHNV